MHTPNCINCGLPCFVLVVAAFLGPSFALAQNVESAIDSTSARVESTSFVYAELANSIFTDDVEFQNWRRRARFSSLLMSSDV